MTCKITYKCIACGDCEPECPRSAISEGYPIYEINASLCNDCAGYYEGPHCIVICPEEGAIKHFDDPDS